MESVAVSRSPKFENRDVRIESYCACCLAPITVDMKNGQLQLANPENPLIHVSKHPDDWAIPSVWTMCDSMNYVIDADHARRYEAKISKRGVLFTIEQARPFVKSVADNRMWDYHWYPGPLRPATVWQAIDGLGVDTSVWDPDAKS
jgi:hypothetical protein